MKQEPQHAPVHGARESPDVEIYQLQDFEPATAVEVEADSTCNHSVKHMLRIELGRTRMTPASVLSLRSGDIVRLNNPADAAHDIYVDDKIVARGQVLVNEGKICVRVEELVNQ